MPPAYGWTSRRTTVDAFIPFSPQGHITVKWECLSWIQFNISYQWTHWSHYYPWQNIAVIVTDNRTKKRKKGDTNWHANSDSLSLLCTLSPFNTPYYVNFCHFSLPALFSSLMHFSLSLIYFLFLSVFMCMLPIVSSFAFSFTLPHCACLLFSIILLVWYLCNSFFHLKLSFLMFDKAG